jgi:uncharacterized protein (DUF488 family)
VEVYTIGFGGHSAEEFFGKLKRAGIRRLVDVRRNNVSQLAGFTKRDDLAYFLHAILAAEYLHDLRLAPSDEILKAYRGKALSWTEYERRFIEELDQRGVARELAAGDLETPTVLLCSEPTADRCHRRLVLEYLVDHGMSEITPVHL